MESLNRSFSSDVMNRRLLEAARLGEVVVLQQLLKEDKQILEKVSFSSSSDTPLHVASLAGQVDFVKKIMELMPSFASEVNKDGLTPLHIAAARGQTHIVNELLIRSRPDTPELCLLKDKKGRTPLHYAATKGRVQAIERLLLECPQAAGEVTLLGETALHLAVKNSQFEAFKIIFANSEGKREINAVDNEGNTILDLAKAADQLQVLSFLKQRSGYDHQEIVIEDSGDYSRPIDPNDSPQSGSQGKKSYLARLTDVFSNLCDKDVTAIVAGLIAQATYQAGMTPPPTVWKEGIHFDPKCLQGMFGKVNTVLEIVKIVISPYSALKSCPIYPFYIFMAYNTLGFVASVMLIPYHKNKKFALPLSFICFSSVVQAYSISVTAIAPTHSFYYFVNAATNFGMIFLLWVPVVSLAIQMFWRPRKKN